MDYTSVSALFTNICDAIRYKDGTIDKISHQDIPDRIKAIKSSDGEGGGEGGTTIVVGDKCDIGWYLAEPEVIVDPEENPYDWIVADGYGYGYESSTDSEEIKKVNLVCSNSIKNMDNAFSHFNYTASPVCGSNVIFMPNTYSNTNKIYGRAASGPNVKYMNYTYYNCSNLTSAYCGDNVKSLYHTFEYCDNLTKAYCGPNVLSMTYTYDHCSNMIKAACGSNVITMYYTYFCCYNITEPVCGDNVIDMIGTYRYCSKIDQPVCGPNVVNFIGTYFACSNIITPICGENVINMTSTYGDCNNIITPICGINVMSMNYTYSNCDGLTVAVCGDNVIDMDYTYEYCYNLITAACGPNVINMYNTYRYCSNLKYAVCGNNVTCMGYTYYNCRNLITAACGSNVIEMDHTYSNCLIDTAADMDCNNVLSMPYAFANGRINNVDLYFNNCLSFSYGFYYSNIYNINLYIAKAANLSRMFESYSSSIYPYIGNGNIYLMCNDNNLASSVNMTGCFSYYGRNNTTLLNFVLPSKNTMYANYLFNEKPNLALYYKSNFYYNNITRRYHDNLLNIDCIIQKESDSFSNIVVFEDPDESKLSTATREKQLYFDGTLLEDDAVPVNNYQLLEWSVEGPATITDYGYITLNTEATSSDFVNVTAYLKSNPDINTMTSFNLLTPKPTMWVNSPSYGYFTNTFPDITWNNSTGTYYYSTVGLGTATRGSRTYSARLRFKDATKFSFSLSKATNSYSRLYVGKVDTVVNSTSNSSQYYTSLTSSTSSTSATITFPDKKEHFVDLVLYLTSSSYSGYGFLRVTSLT